MDFGIETMRAGLVRCLLILAMISVPVTVTAQDMLIENFEIRPETRWRFFTDGVMGGVSSGQVAFEREDGKVHAHMTGRVSTANNGGFIQMRLDLPDAAPENATGVRLVVRGNDQRYFAHLRTRGTVLPWQYYQAGFEVSGEWREVRLPFASFERSGRLLRSEPRAKTLTSIAVVAFGRDHEADIEVRELGFY